MNRPNTRELTVIKSAHVTPHLFRVTLGGENIKSLPAGQESSHIKLIFPQETQRPIMRTYTIRHQRLDEIDIDFVLHENPGPASTWAQNVKPNEPILIAGPGPTKKIYTESDWYLLIGDMTALPAISVNLETLPENATGYAIIEVLSEEDIQTIAHPVGMEIKWIINPHPGENAETLLEQVKALTWYPGTVSVWAACEFSSMKQLRSFFKNDKGVDRDRLYIASYWKLGNNEDQHKAHKRMDSVNAV
ncbi:siderophore-interacting protein [Marinomonas algarum]|uniref:Siderophore-interacting protein n=1 Tax=Marinomonas algarum TaxID=2883105 RepID=A0A9X1IMY4_9GAMM|nr:siderophore-interacting protein [Marinomonas algarum]MCB5161897.1 siderophore-interacting protein [Marinomonas algarum]